MPVKETDRSVSNESQEELEGAEAAQLELKRAYVQLGFGQFDEALDSCERAGELLGDHYLPDTLRGAVLSARGRHKEAVAVLKKVTRRHEGRALPHLYFAEACFLSGREQQARRALDAAEACERTQQETQMLAQLRELWDDLDADVVPPPLEPVME
jgi:predicted Zn-dependent protease